MTQLTLQDKGKLYIESFPNIELLPEYFERKFYDPLQITFVPDVWMSENDCLAFLKTQREYIIDCATKIVNHHDDFYKFFEIEYYDFYKGGTLVNKNGDTTIGHCPMIIHCLPKNKVFHQN